MRYVHNTMFWIQPLKMNVCFDCFAKIMKNPALTGNLRNIHALTYVRRLFLFCCPIIYSYLCSRQIGGTASRRARIGLTASRPARIGGMASRRAKIGLTASRRAKIGLTASRRARMPGTASPVRMCAGTSHLLQQKRTTD